jgi:hypothetical protein
MIIAKGNGAVRVIDKIRKVAPPGTVTPKPEAKEVFRVKGNGTRCGEDAIIYTIPNHSNPNHPYQKGVTASERSEFVNHPLASDPKITFCDHRMIPLPRRRSHPFPLR